MKGVTFAFKIPKSYRRDFILDADGCRHKIEVRGRLVVISEQVGNPPAKPRHQSDVLDWIFESMESVRQEFGQ